MSLTSILIALLIFWLAVTLLLWFGKRDLFTRPVEMFEEVFQKLDIPFTSDIRKCCETLNKRPTSIVNGAPKLEKWRQHNPQAIERIIDKICPLQKKLGYDCDV